MADGITRIAVEGFKSISKRLSIDIAPLTILAGANSSGKSSIMQPLLMLKQTLEDPSDPGPLLISGTAPIVKFTAADQFLSRKTSSQPGKLTVEIALGAGAEFHIAFQKVQSGVQVLEQKDSLRATTLRPNMTAKEIAKHLHQPDLLQLRDLSVIRNRFILGVASVEMPWGSGSEWIVPVVRSILHVPGVRENPWRMYKAPPVDRDFPGTFEPYVASVVEQWQKENNQLARSLNLDLGHLGLAKKVFAQRLSDAEIDLRVNLPGRTSDLVSVADVGSGVSQIMPALVALRAASKGQLVYLEEPEMRLHPRAQIKLVDVLADAAKRGVRMVVETHSSLLLRAVQTLVAKEKLSPDLVRLHWFSLDRHGATRVSSAALDQRGAFGEWPQDFGDVALDSEQDYLDAVENQLSH